MDNVMLKHLARYPVIRAAKGLGIPTPANDARVAAVTEHLLYPSTPVLPRGVLYLDGEGTASAYVAREGARLYLAGNYDKVIFAGSRIPANDPKSLLVFPQLKADGFAVPAKDETEADYMKQVFLRTLFEDAGRRGRLDRLCGLFADVVPGTNTGAKITNAGPAFNGAAAIQAVTLAYSQRRLHGTLRQQLGDEPVISVQGVYPLGITREGWPGWSLSYATVLDEADKSGPTANGGEPAYARFFTPIDVATETARVQQFNAFL